MIRGRWVVATPENVIGDGAVAVADGRIVSVGPAAEVEARYSAARRLEHPQGIVLPGLIDCHVHTCQQLARGLASDVGPGEWPARILPFEGRMSEDEVVASVELACVEMIRTGTTAFVEACANPLHIDAVAEAFARSGLRAVLTRSTVEHVAPGSHAPRAFIMDGRRNIRETRDMIQIGRAHV